MKIYFKWFQKFVKMFFFLKKEDSKQTKSVSKGKSNINIGNISNSSVHIYTKE
jgi:hypothetical protein